VGIILLFLLSSLLPITSSYSSYETNKAYTIHICENGTLSGFVTDPAMNPIEGAVIRAYCDYYCENVSDSSGYYYIDNIPFCYNQHRVCAFKTGYKTIWMRLNITENTKYDFILMPLETIYVDDDNTNGPWDGTQDYPYQFIQDGINHAGNGDTVFVYNGTYYENLIVNKYVDLIGEDRKSTIIDGLNKGNAIYVKVYSVSIENFTIRNGTNGVECGPYIPAISRYIVISHNIIINNDIGIYSSYSENVNIIGNNISNNSYGITFYRVEDSMIKGNHILSNKKIGILFDLATIPGLGCDNNSVFYNIIKKNALGVYLSFSGDHNINYNNFYQNIVDASYDSTGKIDWNHNYWNRPRILPKPVIGIIFIYLPWVNFDWHPAKEPYDIS